MISIKSILLKKGYVMIQLKETSTNHFELKAKINGMKGRFILDTGASSSCVGFDRIDYFKLNAQDSTIVAAGAGDSAMETQEATKNKCKIGKWKYSDLNLVLFNMTHVNTALKNHGAKTVHGIIGADILKRGKAIIDYNKKRLYLKKVIFKY